MSVIIMVIVDHVGVRVVEGHDEVDATEDAEDADDRLPASETALAAICDQW